MKGVPCRFHAPATILQNPPPVSIRARPMTTTRRSILRCLRRVLCRAVPTMLGGALWAQGPDTPAAARLPFTVGEHLVYQGKWSFISLGTAESTIQALDTVRGHEVFRVQFLVKASRLRISVNDSYTSWFDSRTLSSYRYEQHIRDPTYNVDRDYEIFPDRESFVQNKKDTSASVAHPLDDGSFLYFIRTVPLEVGKSYEFHQYFKADRNPVILKVVRRDTIDVPAGRFPCLVIQPTIISGGLFSEGGHAEVWISDDSRRLIVQLKSGLRIGTLNLYLKSIEGPR